MIFIEFFLDTINKYQKFSLGITGTLSLIVINSLRIDILNKREKFEKEYSEFKKPFVDFIDGCLKDENVSLNVSILGHFKEHERVKTAFIHNLHGIFRRKRLNAFNKKWKECEEEYYEVKSLGIFAPVIALAPDEETLKKANPVDNRKWADETRRWEYDRKNRLHKKLLSLLEISKIKIWF